MEKIISFGHLNIDAADELYIGGKRQKAEIFSIGDSQNNDTDIRWQIQNGKLIQKDPVVQAYWYSIIQSNFHSGILVAVDGFEFSAHIPCIQTSDLADCRTVNFGPWNFWIHDQRQITSPYFVGEATNWVPEIDPPVDRRGIWVRLIMDPIVPASLSALIGQEVKLLLPTGVSEPLILKDVTDYDLVCSGRDMKEIVFERASVLNIAAGEEG